MKDNRQKIINIFKQINIIYWTDGKNVSHNTINVRCPFCNDKSNHCGIFINTLVYSCWRCGVNGPFESLLKQLTGYSTAACKILIDEPYHNFKTNTLDQIENILETKVDALEKEKKNKVKKISWPEYSEIITSDFQSILLSKYLKKRNIKLSTIVKYKCRICLVGYYMFRLIIPIYYNGILVSYQAADLTGRARVKYDTAPGNINNYLYDIDNIDEKMMLVEGILDAWRVEKDVCATFGTHITKAQKKLILDKKLKELIFCWDGDAYWKARAVARDFECYIYKVTVFKLPTMEDPDSLGKEYIDEMVSRS